MIGIDANYQPAVQLVAPGERSMPTQSDQLPRCLFAPVEPATAAGLHDTLSLSSAGGAGGAAVLHVTAADRLRKDRRGDKGLKRESTAVETCLGSMEI